MRLQELASRVVSCRVTRFEETLLLTMAQREGLTMSEMLRQSIIREAVRPLFGKPPISDVRVPSEAPITPASVHQD